jgi:sterol desaturase/sphingolipid hydroxylase (fatty acid hydroxylase superfamily)
MRGVLEGVLFAACIAPFFIVLELAFPRAPAKTRWLAIAAAGGMLAINSFVARTISFAPSFTDPTVARILLAWFLAELFGYWLHRAMHQVPLLWRVHKLHHRDVPLAWHQSWLINPLDIALFLCTTALATWLAGAPMTAAPAFLVARRVWAILLHANVRWPPTWLDHVIVTPAVHHRHHREDLRPANFAGTFSLFDRVFATWAR